MRKVLILAQHCDYDHSISQLFLRYNIDHIIFRYSPQEQEKKNQHVESALYPIIRGGKKELLGLIKHCDVVINATNSLFSFLGIKNSLLLLITKKVLIVNWPTGSDITELSLEPSIQGWMYKLFLKFSVIKVLPPYPAALRAITKMKSYNFILLRYPYKLIKLNPYSKSEQDNKVLFLSPSNIDFGINDAGMERNSTKGNDRFIKAFIRAYQKNKNIKCLILDRGPDKEIAKKYIKSSCEEAFEFLRQMSPDELQSAFMKVDCIVDQFDVGGFGMISMEAMAQAKPVMIHIDKNCWPLVYADEPPVINCRTEDEIYNAILEWSDKNKLQALGEKAEKWVRKYHDVHTADFSEFILRVCLAAGLEWPRKDLAKQDS
jgi:glycosyltransferase involved in cell wall biosynthesis